jgi:hypothetical protein
MSGPLAPVLAHTPLEELLVSYCRYQWVERCPSDHTVLDAYGPVARLFLSGQEGPDGLGLERLGAEDVSSFLPRAKRFRRAGCGVRFAVLVCATYTWQG